MGRGYSVNRSATARPGNKEKRPRSVSMAKMRTRLGVIAKEATSNEEMARQIHAMDSDEDLMASEDEDETVRRPDVLSKYNYAGSVVDEAIATVAKGCISGASTFDLCQQGDEFVISKTRGMFQKAKSETGERMKKGLAFPTTVSVNNILCNASPMNESEGVTLQTGDIVKIHVAAHIDGYPASAARTIVVGDASVPAATANALAAAHYAMQGMLRLMKPGAENDSITDYIMHVGKNFGVETVEGVLSNRTKRWILDGMECIIARRVTTEDPQQDVAPVVLGEHEVWTLDVAFTTAPSYRMKAAPLETNIFRRNEVTIQPRLECAQEALKEIRDAYMCFPFTPLRMKNPLRTRLGLKELKKNDMLDTFPHLGSSKGAITTRISCTVAVTDKRVIVLAGKPEEQLSDAVASAATAMPSADISQLMMQPGPGAAKEKGKKKGAVATAAAADEDDDNANAELPTRTRKTHRSGA